MRARFWLVRSLGVTGAAATVWLASTLARSAALYPSVVDVERAAWSSPPFTADASLGYRLRPRFDGWQRIAGVLRVPVHTDASGMRVPTAQPASGVPELLALGCSFTFGTGVAAGEAWPAVAAERLGVRVANAGVPGWGLAQMVLAARRLIPTLRPRFVVVQFSPWLVDRAMHETMPSMARTVPVPYFVQDPHGKVVVAPPWFTATVLDLDVGRWRAHAPGPGRFAAFWALADGPQLLATDIARAVAWGAEHVGTVASPSDDPGLVARVAHDELRALARAAGAQLVFVRIRDAAGFDGATAAEWRRLDELSEVVAVDADEALRRGLAVQSETAWRQRWALSMGGAHLDDHPNAAAHAVVAGELARALAPRAAGP